MAQAGVRLACVILNYRNPEDTLTCLESLRTDGASPLPKIFLVNNHPADGSGPRLLGFLAASGFPFEYIEPGSNVGFAGGCNFGIRAALKEGFSHIVILNNDTVAEPGFLSGITLEAADHPRDVLAGRVTDSATGGPTFNIGRISPITGRARHILGADFREEPDFVSGCLMAVPRSVFETCGLFDENLFMYCEDLDLCMRFKHHRVRIRYCRSFGVRHGVSASVRKSGFPAEYYVQRNQTFVVLRRGTVLQRLVFPLFLGAMLLRKAVFHPQLFRQALRGVWDGLRGRMGKRHWDI